MSVLRSVPKPRQKPKAPRQYVPRVNRVRAAKRRARDFGSISDWLVQLPCCVCGKKTGEWVPVDNAVGSFPVRVIPSHVKSRGAGGRKHANQIPLAAHLEDRQHAHGWEAIGLTLEKAQQLAKEFQELFNRTFATSDETGDDTK